MSDSDTRIRTENEMTDIEPADDVQLAALQVLATLVVDDVACETCAWAVAEIRRLRAELVEWLDIAMRTQGFKEPTGRRKGWWYTVAPSHGPIIGDRHVELGKWERHPDGPGRRQWYRPIDDAGADNA